MPGLCLGMPSLHLGMLGLHLHTPRNFCHHVQACLSGVRAHLSKVRKCVTRLRAGVCKKSPIEFKISKTLIASLFLNFSSFWKKYVEVIYSAPESVRNSVKRVFKKMLILDLSEVHLSRVWAHLWSPEETLITSLLLGFERWRKNICYYHSFWIRMWRKRFKMDSHFNSLFHFVHSIVNTYIKDWFTMLLRWSSVENGERFIRGGGYDSDPYFVYMHSINGRGDSLTWALLSLW